MLHIFTLPMPVRKIYATLEANMIDVRLSDYLSQLVRGLEWMNEEAKVMIIPYEQKVFGL